MRSQSQPVTELSSNLGFLSPNLVSVLNPVHQRCLGGGRGEEAATYSREAVLGVQTLEFQAKPQRTFSSQENISCAPRGSLGWGRPWRPRPVGGTVGSVAASMRGGGGVAGTGQRRWDNPEWPKLAGLFRLQLHPWFPHPHPAPRPPGTPCRAVSSWPSSSLSPSTITRHWLPGRHDAKHLTWFLSFSPHGNQ